MRKNLNRAPGCVCRFGPSAFSAKLLFFSPLISMFATDLNKTVISILPVGGERDTFTRLGAVRTICD